MHWGLKAPYLIWYRKGHCSTCRDLVGISGTLLPVHETASLGDFRGTCISDPETCLNGLSFELWLWFADFDSRKNSSAKSIILHTGGSELSRGFELSVTNTTITFTVYSKQSISESSLQIQNFERWLHIIGVWVKSTKMAQLFADDVNMGCVIMRARKTPVEEMRGDLSLGPVSKLGFAQGFVVLRNLSIWMRTIGGRERRRLFNQCEYRFDL